MQQTARKGQMEESQYRKTQDAETKLNQWYANIAANGGPKDPIEIEDKMIGSGVPSVANTGIAARMKRLGLEQERQRFAAANAPDAAPGVVAPMAPPPEPGSFGADVMERRAADPFAPAPRANMLPGAAAPVATVNNLSAPPQARAAIADLNRRIAANMALGTEQGYKTAEGLQKQATELNRRYTVGTTLMGAGGEIVGTAPAAVPPSRQPNLATDLMIPDPNNPNKLIPNAALIAVKKDLRPLGATVVMPPLEKTEQQEKGKLNVKVYGDIAATADRARKILPALETSEAILNGGFKTGFGADVQTQAARVLSVLGVPEADKYATDSQLFLAQGRQALLQRQLEQKGAQSEGDAQRINQTFIQLGNTPEANKFLVATAKAQSKQDIARQKFYSDFWAKSKTYEGAEESWLAGAGGKSLFDSPEMKSFAPQKPSSDISSAAAAELERRRKEKK